MKLLFASHNENKVKELKTVLPAGIELESLAEIGWQEEVPETSDTLTGNASQKANFLHKRLQINCFADDTGLVVPALDGAPGVYSARYAGPQRSAQDNMAKLEQALISGKDRSAYFETAISLILDDEEHVFVGRVNGHISSERRGGEGFGYDPIFIPEGQTLTFAEMELHQKNQMSHRARAFKKMVDFLAERMK